MDLVAAGRKLPSVMSPIHFEFAEVEYRQGASESFSPVSRNGEDNPRLVPRSLGEHSDETKSQKLNLL